jgi:hypothetical protein
LGGAQIYIGQHDRPRAFGCEAPGHRPADATATSGDDNNLVPKLHALHNSTPAVLSPVTARIHRDARG